MRRSYYIAALLLSALSTMATAGRAADWPMFGHDIRRSRVTDQRLDFKTLGLAWQRTDLQPPIAAWSQPAKGDAFANIRDFQSMRNYDPVVHPIVVGERVYYGSNIDDSVRCLDLKTGKELWIVTVGGPVRIAPTFAEGRIYFGSDDGYAYCVDAETGKQLWRRSPSRDGEHAVDKQRLVMNDGRLISFWPCRSGVLVDGGTAYFACSLLPWKHSYLCAVDAATGEVKGDDRYVHKLDRVTLEGPLVASTELLFSPQGREAPLQFARATGKLQGALGGGFGVFCVLTPDNRLIHGPRRKEGGIADSNAKTRAPIATHKDARAMIVADSLSFLLTDSQLAATDASARKVLWTSPQSGALAMIVAEEALIVGKKDEVAALDIKTGQPLWRSPVDGRAYGVVAAGDSLLVTTDAGKFYCFSSEGKLGPVPQPGVRGEAQDQAAATEAPASVSQLPEKIEDKDLAGRWVFTPRLSQKLSKTTRFKNLRGGDAAVLSGPPHLTHDGELTAVQLDGKSNSITVSTDVPKAALPQRHLTAEAWVRIDKPIRWGGLVGAIQDNGAYERGWLLGFENQKFNFALTGKQGDGKLTYMKAKDDFEPGTWHHVVGTYDGKRMALYIDGELSAAGTTQKGDINYPPRGWYEIGAYRDDNEHYRTEGLLNEVRVYSRVLTADEVAANFKSKELPGKTETWRPQVGPWVQFDSANSAMVRWRTAEPLLGILALTNENGVTRHVESKLVDGLHRVQLPDLRRDRRYTFVIKQPNGERVHVSRPYEVDTYFNFHLADKPKVEVGDALAAKTARRIVGRMPAAGGICVVLGAADNELVSNIAALNKGRTIVLDSDDKRVDAARHRALASGLLGPRLSFVQISSYAELPPRLADLLVAPASAISRMHSTSEVVKRLVQPEGKFWLLTDGLSEADRRKLIDDITDHNLNFGFESDDLIIGYGTGLKDAGIWTHMYGDASNAAYTGEGLGGVKTVDDLDIAWYGRPGPRYQTDRQNRKSSPLFAGGRLYMQGQERVIALNGYNGQILWSLEVPDLLRFNIPRDASNWCCDEDYLYIALRGHCLQIDGATGEVVKILDPVPSKRENAPLEWGYVARSDEMLIGSAVAAGSSHTAFWGGDYWYDQKDGKYAAQICSDNLFAMVPRLDKVAWTYEGGMIWNASLTAGDGRVFFIETRDPKLREQPTGRLGSVEMWKDQHLVGLDLTTGKKLFDQPIQTKPKLAVANMAYSDGTLVLVTSVDNKFQITAHSAKDGKPMWDSEIAWPRNHHGGHLSRPAIVEGKLFVRPAVFDLKSGKMLSNNLPGGGCGTYVCTHDALFFRAGSGRELSAWDHESGKYTHWPRLRPDCWLSTIPAGGMLLSPEGGGGCSCGKWMQMSIGFVPIK